MLKKSDIFRLNVLLWGDTVNRIDGLLMEIRHLQINIIRQIREPGLYALLRYEEDYIWGGYHHNASLSEDVSPASQSGSDEVSQYEWPKLFKGCTAAEVSALVKYWVICLPHQKEEQTSYGGDERFFNMREHKKVCGQVYEIYAARNKGRGWGPSLTHKYELLAASQQLKANLVHDKALLCYWADKTQDFSDGSLETEDSAYCRLVGRFTTIRMSVMVRLRGYIRRLEDIRSPLERELDASIIDNPRPVTMRSRAQGFYNESLDTRSRRFHYVQKKLLRKTKDISEKETGSFETNVSTRWTHQEQSTFAYISDDSQRVRRIRDQYKHFFVNTSFWMDDRPDLCPAICHEIAHDFVDRIYNDLGEETLKYSHGHLGHLLRRLSKVFYVYRNERRPASRFTEQNREILTEIATDFIASMRNGHAYLWMLFQELIGQDLFDLLEQDDRFIDLLKIEEMETAKGKLSFRKDIEEVSHLWSLRLSALCDWVEATDVQNVRNPHAQKLVRAVRGYLKLLDGYIKQYTPYEAASGRGVDFMEDLRAAFGKEIRRHPVTAILKLEQQRWIEGSQNHEYAIDQEIVPAEKLLPHELQRHLHTVMRRFKRQRLTEIWAPRAGQEKPVENLLNDIYNLPPISLPNSLFPSMQDIPWSAAMLRGLDLENMRLASQATGRGDAKAAVFREVLTDFYPGYDLYSSTLELFVWLRTRPTRRLARVARYVWDYLLYMEEEAPSSGSKQTNFDQCTDAERQALPWLCEWLSDKDFLDPTPQTGRSYKHKKPDPHSGVFLLIDGSPNGTRPEMLNVMRAKKLRCLHTYLTGVFSKTLASFTNPHVPMLLSYLNSCSSAMEEKEVEADLQRLLSVFQHEKQILSSPVQDAFTMRPVSLKEPICIAQITQASQRYYDPDIEDEELKGLLYAKWLGDRKSDWRLPEQGNRPIDLYAHMLGRHDIIHITDARNFLVDTHIPEFDRGNDIQAHGAKCMNPFAMRLERGLPVHFSDVSHDNLESLWATLHITLTGRDCRMDFVLRLMKAWEMRSSAEPPKLVPGSLEEVVFSYLDLNQDLLFLIEGNADLLIMFFNRPDAAANDTPDRRLHRILMAQHIIRQDMLVEHVETSFAANALSALAVSKSTPYSISIRVRFKSDRNLTQTVTYIENTLNSLPVLSAGDLVMPKWRRVPGRSDYQIHISPEQLFRIKENAQKLLGTEDGDFDLKMLATIIGADKHTTIRTNAKFAFLIDEVDSTIEYEFDHTALKGRI